MILIDYSQVALSTIFQFSSDLKKGASKESAINIIRHSVLTGLKYHYQNNKQKYGEMVICCDGRNYWRRSLFEYYKADRKKSRNNSDLDWKLIFECISTIREEIKEVLPYRVLHLDETEADDIIAVLSKMCYNRKQAGTGLSEFLEEGEAEPVRIISSDGDFKQLQKYPNVTQFNLILKKEVVCDNPREYLMKHIAKAGDDGIPNVLSCDDTFVNPELRQTRMTAKRLEEFVEFGRDACKNELERRNWDRNRNLIDFDYMPKEIEEKIVQEYDNYIVRKDKMKFFNYLVKNKCRLLIDNLEDFF